MLEKELNGIDAEILVKSWQSGLKKAKGDFVCLLEADSAVSPGTIRRNLSEFTENPQYRKLAMVSSLVDITKFKDPVSWTYQNGLAALLKTPSKMFHSVRIGNVPGAIIRKSSLVKANIKFDLHPWALSTQLSLYFWDNGLRIAMQPESIYYAPEMMTRKVRRPKRKPKPSARVMRIWEQEMIS